MARMTTKERGRAVGMLSASVSVRQVMRHLIKIVINLIISDILTSDMSIMYQILKNTHLLAFRCPGILDGRSTLSENYGPNLGKPEVSGTCDGDLDLV